ncbi:MAG: transporter substrate-binding domain-containing protein [Planctomycetota bacterium]
MPMFEFEDRNKTRATMASSTGSGIRSSWRTEGRSIRGVTVSVRCTHLAVLWIVLLSVVASARAGLDAPAIAPWHALTLLQENATADTEVNPTLPPPGETRPQLVVGIKETPPFIIADPPGTEGENAEKDADTSTAVDPGRWTGISIELLDALARELGFDYELKVFAEDEIAPMLDAVERNEVDLAIAAISMTAERETRLDFSHPYYTAALGIATTSEPQQPTMTLIKIVFAPDVLRVLVGLFVVLTIIGALAWFVERRRNAEQFPTSPLRGIGNGIWWSVVTMTTVGYGDKSPITRTGRVLAVIWMFASIVLISTYTAVVASSLTANQLQTPIDGPEDLADVKVGAIADTNSRAYLLNQGLGRIRTYSTIDEAFAALEDGRVTAVVHDAPILSYRLQRGGWTEIKVLQRTFHPQRYAIALPEDSDIREQLNQALLLMIESPEWRGILTEYTGQTSDDEQNTASFNSGS